TSAGTWDGWPGPASSTTCTSTWCRAGAATPTSCRCSPTSRCSPSTCERAVTSSRPRGRRSARARGERERLHRAPRSPWLSEGGGDPHPRRARLKPSAGQPIVFSVTNPVSNLDEARLRTLVERLPLVAYVDRIDDV